MSSTLIYAKAHDQTVAEDYFTAMERVEQRLEIVPKIEEDMEDVKVQDNAKLLLWVERLALPELCHEERLEIVDAIRMALEAWDGICTLTIE